MAVRHARESQPVPPLGSRVVQRSGGFAGEHDSRGFPKSELLHVLHEALLTETVRQSVRSAVAGESERIRHLQRAAVMIGDVQLLQELLPWIATDRLIQ